MISSIEYMATGISLTAMKRDKRFTNRTIKKKLFFFFFENSRDRIMSMLLKRNFSSFTEIQTIVHGLDNTL